MWLVFMYTLVTNSINWLIYKWRGCLSKQKLNYEETVSDYFWLTICRYVKVIYFFLVNAPSNSFVIAFEESVMNRFFQHKAKFIKYYRARLQKCFLIYDYYPFRSVKAVSSLHQCVGWRKEILTLGGGCCDTIKMDVFLTACRLYFEDLVGKHDCAVIQRRQVCAKIHQYRYDDQSRPKNRWTNMLTL